MRERLLPILEPYRGQTGALIPVLQKVQGELGYLPEDAVGEIAYFLGLSKSEIYGVASFYAQFRFEQQGEHTVKVCQGTACHVKGGQRLLEDDWLVAVEVGAVSAGGADRHGAIGLSIRVYVVQVLEAGGGDLPEGDRAAGDLDAVRAGR